MSRARRPMTVEELAPIVQDYNRAFPEWRVLERELFARENGPLLQYVGFERLSTGSYRPTCGVYYLCVPGRDGSLGPQWLNIPLRQIDPRAHDRLRDRVVEAIHREVVPSVDAPLDAEHVVAMHEAYEVIRSSDAHHLAALNACLGREERALFWCARFPELVEQLGFGWQTFDLKRRTFLNSLRHWIEAGRAKQELARIVQEERRKWGLS